MKKFVGLSLFLCTLIILTACNKDEVIEDTGAPVPIAVDLSVTEKVAVNETVIMEAIVTQGDEKVEDAYEVTYEVWEEGKKSESEMIESTNEKNGLYSAETSFDHDGVFNVQVHVTARDMHMMPKAVVTVGEGAVENAEADEEETDHGTTDGFSMHFMQPENTKLNDEIELMVHLQMDGHPFENARVRYEIWTDNTPDNHIWIDTEELVPGEYTAKYSFKTAESFHVQIHVEDKEGLHEHEEYEIVVGE